MPNTPRGTPEMSSSQALKEENHNEAIRRTEAGACHFPVADRLTTPPGACADGANYIITATATAAWTGKEGQIATAVGTNASNGWYYHVPIEGFTAYVQDENARYLYDGAAWGIDTSGGTTVQFPVEDEGTEESATVQRLNFTGAGVSVTVVGNEAEIIIPGGGGGGGGGAFVTLTDGATVTPDASSSKNFYWLIGGAGRVLAFLTGLSDGDRFCIIIKQDGTGGRTWVPNAKYKFSGGAPVLSTPAGAIDCVEGIYNAALDLAICSFGKYP